MGKAIVIEISSEDSIIKCYDGVLAIVESDKSGYSMFSFPVY